MIISETRPRARQKRNVINVDNIARVPTVNERLRWDLPCIFNLNARSLNTEKIEELQVIASNFNVSIICVTETWLENYIADESVSIYGFYCERRERVNRRTGGVACYVKNDVLCSRIVELEDQSFENLWLKIMPKKLPRAGADPGFKKGGGSNIFVVAKYIGVLEVGGGGVAGMSTPRHSYRDSVILETKIFVI